MQTWGGGDVMEERREKLPFFLTPRTSCLKEEPAKLDIEVWE